MGRERLSRRLTVILRADVVGSTLLVQRDESVAHSRIRAAFSRFAQTIIAYGGAAHEIRGDALVAEFARASDALPAALALAHAAPRAWLVCLVKPQFEAGREAVGKGGIVRDEKDRLRAVARVRDFVEAEGWQVLGQIQSPIIGRGGNVEFLIGARRDA